MNALNRLLVPLDGSRLAEAVLPATELLGARMGASVTLLHVLEEDAPAVVHGESHLTDVAQARTYLAEIADRLTRTGLSVQTHVHPNPSSDVAEGIREHAQECGADLIVLATHGWGGLRDILVGSIAQQVLKRDTPPVLLVKPSPEGEAPPFQGRRMLVPLSGAREHDETVLPLATDFARGLRAQLALTIVVPTRSTLPAETSATAVLLPHASATALKIKAQDSAEYLRKIANPLLEAKMEVTATVLRGEPAAAVLEEATKTGADMIVVATHGRAGWAAFWAGSVGAKILAGVTQPLLLVRVPDREEADG